MGDREQHAFNWAGLVFLAVALVLFVGVFVRKTDATVEVAGPADVPNPATAFGDGTYLVGADVVAGPYRSTGPRPGGPGECFWARQRDDLGGDVIANGLTTGPARFTTQGGEYVRVTGCDFVFEPPNGTPPPPFGSAQQAVSR